MSLSDQPWVRRVLDSAETLTRVTQRALLSPTALAREFSEADLSPEFKANGSTDPDDPDYKAHAEKGFADWKLVVGGLVESPLELSLAELRAMPSRTQITRHDCVEGWSCIGKWKGVPLKSLLDAARLKPNARYIVLYCADDLGQTGTEAGKYYEIDRASRRVPSADHSRLRDERPGAACSPRRAAQAARGAAARLQDGEICDAHRGRRPASPAFAAAMAASGKISATSGTPAFESRDITKRDPRRPRIPLATQPQRSTICRTDGASCGPCSRPCNASCKPCGPSYRGGTSP